MHIETAAIVCAVLPNGEHGAIVRLLTPEHGLQAGYVRGGRSRRLRPILVPGNVVQAELRARVETQLSGLTVELLHSRAPLLAEPLPAAAIDWATTLAAVALPEGQPYPRLYAMLKGLLEAIEMASSARGWATSLIRYELLLLAELGFGLDLSECGVTGARDELCWVSPKSGRAVSRSAGEHHAARLLALPPFLIGSGPAAWSEIASGFRLTGHFLKRDLLTERRAIVLAARERLLDRLERLAD